MKILSLKIKNLFNIFDYEISLDNEENLLILTGPNGFGKTTILKIIYSLFNKDFYFFQKFPFESITLNLSNDISIVISAIYKFGIKDSTSFSFMQNDKEFYYCVFAELEINFLMSMQFAGHISKYDENTWADSLSNKKLSLQEVFEEYSESFKKSNIIFLRKKSIESLNILDAIKVLFITDDRLNKKVENHEKNGQEILSDTIEVCSKELKEIITGYIQKFSVVSQELESTYPNRLITQKEKITEKDYKKQFNLLQQKQEKLRNFGLYEGKHEAIEYSTDDSKALLVYLNDLEKKLEVFDPLLEKLDLFKSILNERRFTYKHIWVDGKQGFYFKTDGGEEELQLNQLSLGEQHEVVLLYELIFKANENVLVLIDEPEISLHVTWQKEFVRDLLKIIKKQNFYALIATHSPSIINDRWDLAYNLEKNNA